MRVGTLPIACSRSIGRTTPSRTRPGTLGVRARGRRSTWFHPQGELPLYGEVGPVKFTPGYSGFLPGEAVSVVEDAEATCAPTTAVASVGTYTITCSGAADPGYTFIYADSPLALRDKPAELTRHGPRRRASSTARRAATFARTQVHRISSHRGLGFVADHPGHLHADKPGGGCRHLRHRLFRCGRCGLPTWPTSTARWSHPRRRDRHRADTVPDLHTAGDVGCRSPHPSTAWSTATPNAPPVWAR